MAVILLGNKMAEMETLCYVDFFHLQNGLDIFMTDVSKAFPRLSVEARVMIPAFTVNVTTRHQL
jgi:hypothetical protein